MAPGIIGSTTPVEWQEKQEIPYSKAQKQLHSKVTKMKTEESSSKRTREESDKEGCLWSGLGFGKARGSQREACGAAATASFPNWAWPWPCKSEWSGQLLQVSQAQQGSAALFSFTENWLMAVFDICHMKGSWDTLMQLAPCQSNNLPNVLHQHGQLATAAPRVACICSRTHDRRRCLQHMEGDGGEL